MTDMTGTPMVRYDYDLWGRETKVSGTMDADFGYAGYYQHLPSGLNLTMFRGYDPNLGRWISRDPLGERGGTNLYGYVRNSPIGRIDRMGLQEGGEDDDDETGGGGEAWLIRNAWDHLFNNNGGESSPAQNPGPIPQSSEPESDLFNNAPSGFSTCPMGNSMHANFESALNALYGTQVGDWIMPDESWRNRCGCRVCWATRDGPRF